MVFAVRSVTKCYKQHSLSDELTLVKDCSNISIVALKALGGDENVSSAWGYKLTTYFWGGHKYGDLELQVAGVSNPRQ
jgi:hypothetical protein